MAAAGEMLLILWLLPPNFINIASRQCFKRFLQQHSPKSIWPSIPRRSPGSQKDLEEALQRTLGEAPGEIPETSLNKEGPKGQRAPCSRCLVP